MPKVLGEKMGAVIGGLVSFLFGLILILVIASALWTIFFRVILPLGLIVLLGMGVYWVYEKIASPKEEEIIIQQVPQEPQPIIPDVFIAPTEKI